MTPSSNSRMIIRREDHLHNLFSLISKENFGRKKLPSVLSFIDGRQQQQQTMMTISGRARSSLRRATCAIRISPELLRRRVIYKKKKRRRRRRKNGREEGKNVHPGRRPQITSDAARRRCCHISSPAQGATPLFAFYSLMAVVRQEHILRQTFLSPPLDRYKQPRNNIFVSCRAPRRRRRNLHGTLRNFTLH